MTRLSQNTVITFLIFLCATCLHRFAYYGFLSFLVFFLMGTDSGQLGLDNQTASAMYDLFQNTRYISLLIGGVVACFVPSRIIIALTGTCFLIGILMLIPAGKSLITLSLVLVAIGSGASLPILYGSCLAPLAKMPGAYAAVFGLFILAAVNIASYAAPSILSLLDFQLPSGLFFTIVAVLMMGSFILFCLPKRPWEKEPKAVLSGTLFPIWIAGILLAYFFTWLVSSFQSSITAGAQAIADLSPTLIRVLEGGATIGIAIMGTLTLTLIYLQLKNRLYCISNWLIPAAIGFFLLAIGLITSFFDPIFGDPPRLDGFHIAAWMIVWGFSEMLLIGIYYSLLAKTCPPRLIAFVLGLGFSSFWLIDLIQKSTMQASSEPRPEILLVLGIGAAILGLGLLVTAKWVPKETFDKLSYLISPA